MKRMKKKVALLVAALLLVAIPISAAAQQTTGPEWHLEGTEVRLIGGYGDNFSYDGSKVTKGSGRVEIHVNSDTDVGSIVASFTVPTFHPSKDITLKNPQVTLIYPLFGFPPEAQMPACFEGGIADSVTLHGDSGCEAPIMPKHFDYLASWGPVLVFVNGEQLKGAPTMMGMDNPMGAFLGHLMYGEQVRDPETFKLYQRDGKTPYSPKEPGNGSVASADPNDRMIHLVARSEVEDPSNFPGFDFFLHVNFDKVTDAAPAMIPTMTFADMMATPMDQLMTMIMGMMPPAALPVTGGASPETPGGLSIQPLALASLLLIGAGIGLRRRVKASR